MFRDRENCYEKRAGAGERDSLAPAVLLSTNCYTPKLFLNKNIKKNIDVEHGN